MWIYEKKLQYPVRIKNPNPALAKLIISQYGGPHGELGASLRYLSQRYSMPYPELRAILTDIGTEELAHLEMVGTIVYQLTRNLTQEEIQKQGFDAYFIDHTTGVYPAAASGAPFSAACIAVTGDTLADINEDLAAEQKARVTYDNILRFADDPDVRDPIKSCASARLCITSASARVCASRPIGLIPKTSTRLTPRSTKQNGRHFFGACPFFLWLTANL